MNKSINVDWNGHNVKLTWIPTDKQPDSKKVTSVHGYCFDNDRILLVKVDGRGFNIPGGHVEEGETPEQAFHREALEEGCIRGNAIYLGMIEISNEHNTKFDPNGKYPYIGYQLFYRMNITSILPFDRKNETLTRIWVEPGEIPFVINDHELSLLILDEALKAK
ncbi:NUDIX hydrolase [Cohnella sp. AR92]|uniref:NUDIX hydrolase n=1 Tax=Cohnella sp. AR92 TaxID=648716 RepID=UPI000F8F6187|nr:NUDIX domain-containing protein [Cohnella sp. AR92]RUS41952.1 NUDIX domain-containing protein [Cohnella sp. AR92]